jgi:acetyl esterase/lipase
VRIERETKLPGAWFIAPVPGPTVLYLHGGGYAFYPRMTDNIVAAVSLAVGGRTFALHYPLAPEHPFSRAFHLRKSSLPATPRAVTSR